MHVSGISLDLNWFLQLIFTVFIIAFGLLHLVKNTASKYFEVDANFEGGSDRNHPMPAIPMDPDDSSCAVCGNLGTKKCSRCKAVRYCSATCQSADWNSGHKTKCKDLGKVNSSRTLTSNFGFKASGIGATTSSGIALVPASGSFKTTKQPRKVLFPYEEFVELFNWDKPGFAPCGLLNCGNSCFANVVLQCLAYTRPLVAYLLEKGHRRECRRNDWCFLCEFQTHVERAGQSSRPFSPINILSRLPNIGGNLGYGRQEDAHEFMRFAIDTMQSVCLDEFGGEKAVDPTSRETTLIQHIFGGHLQSQVICTKCNKVSNQLESMMDLTVEIHGDAASLEECLEQFTAKEWLHGENMYKCDGCNDYVKAWKRLTIQRAPNVLTIALKRFQSGRFGKLNKRVSFPVTLDLGPYMSEEGDGCHIYKLYAVVVHVDMLNASFFGHYICYTKDFRGNWYRIDDDKVTCVELEEVLSQGAYMLLYNRVSARSSCFRTIEPLKEEQKAVKVEPLQNGKVEYKSTVESDNPSGTSGSLCFDSSGSLLTVFRCKEGSSVRINSQSVREISESTNAISFMSSIPKEVSGCVNKSPCSEAARDKPEEIKIIGYDQSHSDSEQDPWFNKNLSSAIGSQEKIVVDSKPDLCVSEEVDNSEVAKEDSQDLGLVVDSKPSSAITKDTKDGSHSCSVASQTSLAGAHGLDGADGLDDDCVEARNENGTERGAEIMEDRRK